MSLQNITVQEKARLEINESLMLSIFSMRQFGLSFDPAKTRFLYWRQKIMLWMSFLGIFYHIFGDLVYMGVTMTNSPRVEDVVPLFHTFGYGLLSSFKLFAIWWKKDVFGQSLRELVDIWPVPPLEPDAQAIKDKSLAALRIAHRWFFAFNMSGVWFYILTPLVVYGYEVWWLGNEDAQIGFVWACWYPFDKRDPLKHFLVYLFEIFSGITCVWAICASDLLFTGISSHICMLLRLLHQRLTALATTDVSQDQNYADIIQSIKLHQRLIEYCNELEKAFSIVNLVNIVLSSINICCVVFVIVLLEPLVAISNKLFLFAAMTQIGVICWYSDDIFHADYEYDCQIAHQTFTHNFAPPGYVRKIQISIVMLENADVAVAAYNSGWYKTDPRCRRALLFLIKRSQKPIAFTAMNFTNINLTTYSSILTRSYSYFALLYTMYTKK